MRTNLGLIVAAAPMVAFAAGKAAPADDLTLWYAQPAKTWMTDALPIGNGRLGGMVFGTVESERIQFNETLTVKNIKLKTAVEELKQTNIQLQQFAFIASHDLQEPLRKIVVFSNLLLHEDKYELSPDVKICLIKLSMLPAE